jgi:hypothetical protein
MSVLAASQEGAASVAEALRTASRIDPSDFRSWLREWQDLARKNSRRADDALAAGQLPTACANWLRATTYYLASIRPPDAPAEVWREATRSAQACMRLFIRHGMTGGEVVTLGSRDGAPLEGYFVAGDAAATGPSLLCIGEPHLHKESILSLIHQHAGRRRMSMLAIDCFGAGSDLRPLDEVDDQLHANAISTGLDHLLSRKDVDAQRIVVMAAGASSSRVARAVAANPRVAAVVCDAGLWEAIETRYLLNRRHGGEQRLMPGVIPPDLRFEFPVLVTTGEFGWLDRSAAESFLAPRASRGENITLKTFRESDTASAQGHFDNPTAANEYIFDWIEQQFR